MPVESTTKSKLSLGAIATANPPRFKIGAAAGAIPILQPRIRVISLREVQGGFHPPTTPRYQRLPAP